MHQPGFDVIKLSCQFLLGRNVLGVGGLGGAISGERATPVYPGLDRLGRGAQHHPPLADRPAASHGDEDSSQDRDGHDHPVQRPVADLCLDEGEQGRYNTQKQNRCLKPGEGLT